jgi:solute:Na+ symporter, SSS family
MHRSPYLHFLILFIVTISVLLLPSVSLMAKNDKRINQIDQRSIGSLKEIHEIRGDEGLAGTFAGMIGNSLIIAGGSAFPEGKPWENGEKYFSDAILVFELAADGTLKLQQSNKKLPYAVAEGASVQTTSGIVCIGGLTPEGVTDEVLLISSYNDISGERLPRLPVPLKSSAAAAMGSLVYVVGGENEGMATSYFFVLNLSQVSDGWQRLPDFPVPVSAAMAVSQINGEEVSLYVFGGRALQDGDRVTTFYAHVYRFRPSQGKWEKLKNISLDGSKDIFLAAAVAVPVGASHVVMVGGDNGIVYNQVEQAISAMQAGEPGARQRRDSLWLNHPGFNDRILIYNTITDTWSDEGAWEGSPIAVAPAVRWGNAVIVPGGEIRPGVRHPNIKQLKFSVQPVFGWFNYVVLGVYFGGMLFLGFYFMKKEGDTNDFFKAGGRIPWWAAGISIFATTLSAITFISIPAKAYATDWRMFMYNMSIILIAPVVIRYYLPFFRRFSFDTAYEYLHIRFDKSVRWLASSLFVIFMISRIAIVLFLPSLALNAVTGFSVYWSIIIMGVVTIIYCTSGGMEAVVWGDVVQGFILMAGALVALIFMLAGVEGECAVFWISRFKTTSFIHLIFILIYPNPCSGWY